MKKLLLLTLIFTGMIAHGQEGLLQQYRWENRIVLLFGSESDSAIEKQIKELKSAPEGIAARDLLLFHINKDVKLLNEKVKPSVAEAWQFRKEYNIVPNEFRYILIGKDGGVKYNKKNFVPNKKLFAVIDAMPMRQRKMKEDEY